MVPIVTIDGPSGSGKTTLFNMVGALDRPSRGNVSVNGVQMGSLSQAQIAYLRCHNIGYIFQSFTDTSFRASQIHLSELHRWIFQSFTDESFRASQIHLSELHRWIFQSFTDKSFIASRIYLSELHRWIFQSFTDESFRDSRMNLSELHWWIFQRFKDEYLRAL